MAVNDAMVGLDPILQQLGAFGKYNIVNYALLLFPIYLAGIFGSIYVFEAPDIGYRCKVSECEHLPNSNVWIDKAIPRINKELSKCSRYPSIEDDDQRDVDQGTFSFLSADKNDTSNVNIVNINERNMTCEAKNFNNKTSIHCDSYVYNDEDSAVRDFDLGCQNWKRTLIGTIHNSGLFVSLPLTGFISDKYGRRVALSVASLMNGIFGILRSFSTNYIMLLVFEFLEAALGAGAYSTAFVIAVELVGPKGRVFGNTIINVLYVFGLMTLAGLSWWLQSWRTLLRVVYTPALFVISYLWILNESVRWLLSKGRHQEATVILKKAATMNKVELSEELLSPLYELEKPVPESDEKGKEHETQEKKTESNFVKVFKSSIIRQRVMICSFLWITCTFVYYGLSINSVSLAGNKYVNFMLVGFVEIPANFACLFVLDRYGRKRTLITTYVLSACLCISLSFLPKDQKWWSLFIYLSGKFSITVAYSSVYIYVSEVFPTSVRQSLLAICSSLGRVGSTMAPLTPLLALYYDNLPSIFFGSLALVASVLVFTLPETINMPLPDTIEEAERLSKDNNKKTLP